MIFAIYNHENYGTEYDHSILRDLGFVLGNKYIVTNIYMGQSHTNIELKGFDRSFNSINFDFEENGEELDIYSDRRFNPYL